MSASPLDFAIVGAMKCGTSTLHAQLAQRSGIFMTTPKEPQFFSDDESFARGADWYAGLFRDAGPDQICGESSTHYTKLPTHPDTVRRMKSHSPKVKLIYLMRDPIERIVSQYLHEWSRREVKGSLEEAVDRNERFLAYSCYARQLEPFLEAFGSAQVLVVFFERLMGEPDAEFSRVCRFIGDPSEEKPCWDAGLGARNVAGERLRNSSLREGLLSLAPIRALKDRIPQGARDVLKSPWRAPKRPVPSDALRARLESEIDRDLEHLAGWLGIELSCGNWAERMRSLPGDTLHWRAFS